MLAFKKVACKNSWHLNAPPLVPLRTGRTSGGIHEVSVVYSGYQETGSSSFVDILTSYNKM